MFKKSLLYVGTIVCMSILGVTCSTIHAAEEKESLVIGIQDNTITLDPAQTSEIAAYAIINQLYDKLVQFELEDFSQPEPGLAETWEVAEDGKIWTFHLRHDVLFSSGNPVNAEAVVFSLRRAIKLDGLQAWRLTQFGLTEESITKIDDYTVQLVLNKTYAPGLLFASLFHPIGSIIDPTIMEHAQNGDMGRAWLDTHSEGSGRFILQERVPDETTTLIANENYWGKQPKTKTVIIKNVTEPIERTFMLEEGEIDVAWDLQPDQIARLEENFDITLYQNPTMKLHFIGMSLDYEPFAKTEVRQAIRYSIDYDTLVDFVVQSAGTKHDSFIPKGMLGDDPKSIYELDREKAKQLLSDAGYPDGFDVELLHFDYSPWMEIGYQIKSDLAKVGINVILKPESDGDVWGAVDAREFQMYMARWQFNVADPDACAKAFAFNDSLGDDASIKLLAWVSRYLDPEVSTQVEQAAKELERSTRQELYTRIARTVMDEGPYAILYSPLIQYAVRSEVIELLGVPSPLVTGLPSIR